jgi:outer membrane protein OmpA-like peptidoglycan-associated protein
MLTKLLALGGFASLMYLPFMCSNCIQKSDGIAALLQSNVSSGLVAGNIQNVAVKADGRDIVLTGPVPTDAVRVKAGLAAMAVSGVRTVDNQLIVQPDAAEIQTQINDILISKKIEFATGRDVLLPVSTPVLEEVLKVLNQAPALKLKIEGHTDNQGNAVANRALSQGRAQAVVNWFGQHGITKERMSAAGFGPDKPIAENATPEGRAKNRRVEIVANN